MTGPYPYTSSIAVIAQRIIDKLKVQSQSFTLQFAPEDVYYGDQDIIPRTPSVCVEPGTKNRDLAGVPNMTNNEFQIYILVYHNKVQDAQVTRKETDELSYEIEQFMHQDLQLKDASGNPLLIHGFCRSNESGYARKSGTLYRSARITFFGKNKTSLPVA